MALFVGSRLSARLKPNHRAAKRRVKRIAAVALLIGLVVSVPAAVETYAVVARLVRSGTLCKLPELGEFRANQGVERRDARAVTARVRRKPWIASAYTACNRLLSRGGREFRILAGS